MKSLLKCMLVFLVTAIAGQGFAKEQAVKFRWTVAKYSGAWTLYGQDWSSGFDEQDSLIRITCKGRGNIQLGVGADVGVGKGNREPVGMWANSGLWIVRIDGVSRRSPDYEMTGGIELVKQTTLNDPLIALLKSNGQVTFRNDIEPDSYTIPADGFGVALTKFLTRCPAA